MKGIDPASPGSCGENGGGDGGIVRFEIERRLSVKRRARSGKEVRWLLLLLFAAAVRVGLGSRSHRHFPSRVFLSPFDVSHQNPRACVVAPSPGRLPFVSPASWASPLEANGLAVSASSRARCLRRLRLGTSPYVCRTFSCLLSSSCSPDRLFPGVHCSAAGESFVAASGFVAPVFPSRAPAAQAFPRDASGSSCLASPVSVSSFPSSRPRRRASPLASHASFPQSPPPDTLPEYFHNYPPAAEGDDATRRFRPGLTAEMEKALVGYEFGVRFSRPSDDQYVPGFTQSRIAAAVRPHKSLAAATIADALGPRPAAAPRPTGPFDAAHSQDDGDTETPRDQAKEETSQSATPSNPDTDKDGPSSSPSSSPSSLRFYDRFPYDAQAAGAPPGDAREFAAAERRREEERKKAEREEENGFQVGLQIQLLREGVLSIMGGEGALDAQPRGEDSVILMKRKVPVNRLKLFQWDNLEVASAGGHLPPLHLSLVRAVELLRTCRRAFGPEGAPRHFAVPPPSRSAALLQEEATAAAARALADEADAHSAEQALETFRNRQGRSEQAWPAHLVGLSVGDQKNASPLDCRCCLCCLFAVFLLSLGFRWEEPEPAEDEAEEFSIFLEAFAAYMSAKQSGTVAREDEAEAPAEVSLDPLHPSPALAPPRAPLRAPPALPGRLPASQLPSRFFKIPAREPFPEYLWGYPLGAMVAEVRKGRKFLRAEAVQLLLGVEFPIQTIEGIERFLSANGNREKTPSEGTDTTKESEAAESTDGLESPGEDEGFVEALPLADVRRAQEARERESEDTGSGEEVTETNEKATDATETETDAKTAFVKEVDIRELRNLLADVANFEEAAETAVSASRPSAPAAEPAQPQLAFPVSPYYELIVPAEFPLPPPARVPEPRRGLRWRLQALQERLCRASAAANLGQPQAADPTPASEAQSVEDAKQSKKRGKEGKKTGGRRKKLRNGAEEKVTEAEKDDPPSGQTPGKPFLGDRALRYPHTLVSRRRTEGGFHYAFDKWSFDDVVEAMQYFNDMYEGTHREVGAEEPLTFNVLPRGWCIPSPDHRTFPKLFSPFSTLPSSSLSSSPSSPSPFSASSAPSSSPSSPASSSPSPSPCASSASMPEFPESLWPREWWGMPLGKYIHAFRIGDIDAKFHPRRRPVLDRLGLTWGDPLQYLHFTWMKLIKAMRWWMLFRGQPLEQLFPWTVIPESTFVANVCKPEEVQGVKIGYLVHMARRQENILYHYYPHRFEIYKRLNLNILPADRLLLDFPFKVEKKNLPLQGELGYLIPHVPEEQREDV
ncbi:conserved hypothetical protein [Neospora caninum Liverpool]|uniref:Uncharacterized protein n=1 Tax=Neospora caninum (strain Liverpool) TaxID=572307 RepID=F0VFI8_NEOCL|nr:conserved hypothetical protein [Neospora caninum Liverpool]CBZ52482.1 conserved hypothetical protein [Neospora caninum Liverpool]|eukprot:XP_003882514.1 conserved hypothetical protein [Neospora caninum Liverpool]